MKDVVRGEVLKLLDVGIIYPIADSKWKVLSRCEEKNLVLNWEKCKFMVTSGIVLGHIVSSKGIEVDKSKIELIANLSTVKTVKDELEYRLQIKFSHLVIEALVGSPIVVFTDHASLKYLLAKKDAKPRLIRWILLLQEFNITIKDKKEVENVVTDHLSRLMFDDSIETMPLKDTFPDEQLFIIIDMPWYADIVNYLVTSMIPCQWSAQDRRQFLVEVKNFFWDDPYLFKYFPDQIIRRCVPNNEINSVISFCHSEACGGHFSSKKIVAVWILLAKPF
ncbi:uncharacterized protein LOC114256317 [Camellia sinensis]|uniref:uncharacterized protein LOC114256317 n=1 Tax=Camellia sinensis TaxID=4442 RepID=UPI00103684CE|nr:uncharacterized protein LOC114256317 [Camellia sinensis]